MRRARHPLDRWQADSVELMLACQTDGQWAHFEYAEWVPRQNGKGGALQARAITGFLLLGEELILWSAHLYKTAVEMFRRVKRLIRALGRRVKPNDDDLWWVPAVVVDEETGEPREEEVLVKVTNANDNRGFERLDTGARIQFIARSAGGGRGMSGDLNIVDETFDYDQDEHAALLYTLSARPNPQIIYTSTPPLRGDAAPIMYELRRRGDPTVPRTAEDGPWEQDASLGYRDWGHPGDLEDLQVDVDDLSLAACSNPALGIRITWKTVRNELKSDRAGYPRERLGIWPREVRTGVAGWQVIGETAWSDAHDAATRVTGRPALGVYVPPDRSYAAIGIAGESTLGGRHLEVCGNGQVLDYRPGAGWVVERLKELERNNPSVVVIDDKALAEEAEAAGLVVHRASAGDMVTACQMLYDGVAGPDVDARDVRHIGQQVLTDAVRGAVKRDVGGSWAWARRDLTVDVTPLAAVSLALLGHCTPRIHRPEAVVLTGSLMA